MEDPIAALAAARAELAATYDLMARAATELRSTAATAHARGADALATEREELARRLERALIARDRGDPFLQVVRAAVAWYFAQRPLGGNGVIHPDLIAHAERHLGEAVVAALDAWEAIGGHIEPQARALGA